AAFGSSVFHYSSGREFPAPAPRSHSHPSFAPAPKASAGSAQFAATAPAFLQPCIQRDTQNAARCARRSPPPRRPQGATDPASRSSSLSTAPPVPAIPFAIHHPHPPKRQNSRASSPPAAIRPPPDPAQTASRPPPSAHRFVPSATDRPPRAGSPNPQPSSSAAAF